MKRLVFLLCFLASPVFADTVTGNLLTSFGTPLTIDGITFTPDNDLAIGASTIFAIPARAAVDTNGNFSTQLKGPMFYDASVRWPSGSRTVRILTPGDGGTYTFNTCAQLAINAQMYPTNTLVIVGGSSNATNLVVTNGTDHVGVAIDGNGINVYGFAGNQATIFATKAGNYSAAQFAYNALGIDIYGDLTTSGYINSSYYLQSPLITSTGSGAYGGFHGNGTGLTNNAGYPLAGLNDATNVASARMQMMNGFATNPTLVNPTILNASSIGMANGGTPSVYVDVTKPPFNAPTDGFSDASAAVQAAINFAAYSNNVMLSVFFPAGDYWFSNTVHLPLNTDPSVGFSTFKKRFEVFGSGDITRIIYTNLGGSAFDFFCDGVKTTNQLSRFSIHDLSAYGAWPDSAVYATGSWPGISQGANICSNANFTQSFIACGSTSSTTSACGQFWTLDAVDTFGFYIGFALSNIDYLVVKNSTVIGNSHASILLAGDFSVDIGGGGTCNLGGAYFSGISWTNDLSDVVMVPNKQSQDCVNISIQNCEGGFGRSLFYVRGAGTYFAGELTVRNCQMEGMLDCIGDAQPGYLTMMGVSLPYGFSTYTPCYLRAATETTADLSKWTIVDPQSLASAPFIIGSTGTLPTRDQLPHIFREEHPEGQNGYSTATYAYSSSAIASNLFMQVSGQLYLLPRSDYPTRADMESLLGRELLNAGNSSITKIWGIDPSSGGYMGTETLSGGTPVSPVTTQLIFPLKRWLDNDAIIVHWAWRNANTPSTNYFAVNFDLMSNTGTNYEDQAAIAYCWSTNQQWMSQSMTLSPSLHNWTAVGRYLSLYIQRTNSVVLGDVSVEYPQAGTLYPFSSGYRLPIKYP